MRFYYGRNYFKLMDHNVYFEINNRKPANQTVDQTALIAIGRRLPTEDLVSENLTRFIKKYQNSLISYLIETKLL